MKLQLSFFDKRESGPKCVAQKYKLTLVKEESFSDYKIQGVKAAVEFLKKHLKLDLEPEEVFICLCLDIQLNIVGIFEVARGTLDSALISTRKIFKRALLTNCHSIIVAHNHPGGCLRPSTEDIKTTQKIKDAAKLLDIKFNDHIIVTENSYYSFAEAGII